MGRFAEWASVFCGFTRPKRPTRPRYPRRLSGNPEDSLQPNFEDDIQTSSCDTCARVQSLDIHPGTIAYIKNDVEHWGQGRPFVVVWTYQEPGQPIRAKGYSCTDRLGSSNSLRIQGEVNRSDFKQQWPTDRTLSLKDDQHMRCCNFVDTEAGLQDLRIDDLERWNGQNFELNAAGLSMLQGIEGYDNMVEKSPCGHGCRSARTC